MTVYDSLDDAIEDGKHVYRETTSYKFLYCPHIEAETTLGDIWNYCPVCGISLGSDKVVTNPENGYWVTGHVPC